MRWASIRRAACFGGRRCRRWWVYLLGFASAVLTVLLIADVGLILDLVHGLRGEELALDNWRFAAWLGIPDASSGWLDRYENCLLGLLAALLILATAESLLLLLLFRAGELAAWDAVAQLQIAVYEQVRRLGVPDWFEREGRQAEQRVLADCLAVREGLAARWTTVPRSVSALVLLLALAAYIDFFLSLLAILLVLFIWRLYQRLETRSDAAKRNAQAQLAARQQAVLEAFRTARIVEGVTAAASDDDSFAAAFDRYRRDTRHGLTARVAPGPWLLWLLGMGAALLLLVVGLSPRPTPTGLGVLALTLARLSWPVIRLRRAIQTIRQADEAAAEVFAYLDRTPGVGQIAGALALPGLAREIRWEGVCIAGHAGRPLLADLSLSIPAGSQTALVASDCHAPLTMVGLFLRHKDPGAGRILVDGTDLRSVTLRSLREQIAFAAADGMLFSGTIADNIRCGRTGLTQDQIDATARRCEVYEAIKDLPEAFATAVGPGGTNVAAATAFRIGLARAMIGNPAVLIVQEPPEPVEDQETQAIDAALQQVRVGRTLVVIPSRLAMLRAADRVFLIHQGRLHAAGTHTELLQANALYRHLNYVLFTPFRDVMPCGPNDVR
jgi:subfamily B ATP-binding cassette protein MsbA